MENINNIIERSLKEKTDRDNLYKEGFKLIEELNKIIEVWKLFPDSICSVSTFGRIRNNKTGTIYKPFLNTTKYEMVDVTYKDGKHKRKLVNRLVAQTFLENPENKPFVDHIDGNVLNNKLSNLRYATREENGMNRPLQKNNTSGYAGVSKSGKLYVAVIKHNGIVEHLGKFEKKEEAIEKRKEAERKYFSCFRRER